MTTTSEQDQPADQPEERIESDTQMGPALESLFSFSEKTAFDIAREMLTLGDEPNTYFPRSNLDDEDIALARSVLVMSQIQQRMPPEQRWADRMRLMAISSAGRNGYRSEQMVEIAGGMARRAAAEAQRGGKGRGWLSRLTGRI